MTEKQRQYRKERSKRIVVNLTMEDYKRWQFAADYNFLPLASLIRKLMEHQIEDVELDMERSQDPCKCCAYNDEGSCSCYDKKSICCPYADDEEEGD